MTKMCELQLLRKMCWQFFKPFSAGLFAFSLFILLPVCHCYALPFDFCFILLWLLNNIEPKFSILVTIILVQPIFHANTIGIPWTMHFWCGFYSLIYKLAWLYQLNSWATLLIGHFSNLKLDCRNLQCAPILSPNKNYQEISKITETPTWSHRKTRRLLGSWLCTF